MPTTQQVQQFRQWAISKGYNESQINQEIARKTQEEAKQQIYSNQKSDTQPVSDLPTQITSTQINQPKSFGGLLKNAGQDVVDFAVNAPVQTVKNFGALGFEIGRAGVTRRINKKSDELLKVIQQLKSETNPAKKQVLIQRSRQISSELEQLNQPKQAQQENPLYTNIGTVSEIGKGILKNLGKMVGLTKDESGKIVFDLNTALQSAYEKPVTTALVAKDAYSLVKRPGAEASAISKAPGKLEKVGTQIRSGVLNPKTSVSPFASEEAASLQTLQKKLGLEGSSQAQLEQLPSIFRKSTKEIESYLSKAKVTKKGILADEFAKEIDSANYTIDDPQFSRSIATEQKIIDGLDGKSAIEQYRMLEKYRSLLKSTRKKIEKGTTLLPKEEARLATFNAIKSSIDSVSPEVRQLNTLQNQIYNLSEGLIKSSKQKGIGVGPLRLPTRTSQALQDTAGRILQGTTGVKQAIVSKIPSINTQPGLGTAMAGIGSVNSQQPSQSMDNQVQNTETQPQQDIQANDNIDNVQSDSQVDTSIHPIFGNLSKQQVLLDAFQKGLNGKQLDEIAGIYDKFAPIQATVSEDTQKVANDLRKEYISETKNNNFREITNSYKKVLSTPNTPAGDVSLVFAYMKMLDPGSVVREGEFATAQNTAGIPDRIVNAYNRAVSGKRLSEQQRAGFIEASKSLYNGYKSSQDDIDKQYTDLAKRYGIDPSLLGIGTIQVDKKKITEPSPSVTESPKKTSMNPFKPNQVMAAGEDLSPEDKKKFDSLNSQIDNINFQLEKAKRSNLVSPIDEKSLIKQRDELNRQSINLMIGRKETPKQKEVKPISSTPKDLESYFINAANEYDIPVDILTAQAHQESGGFDKNVLSGKRKSSSGATGIMQFMPSAIKELKRLGYPKFDPNNPEQAIKAGAFYLRTIADRTTNGDIVEALKAYNAGEGNYKKYGKDLNFPETKKYVENILNLIK